MELHEILEALTQGKVVNWCNSGYRVIEQGGRLYTVFNRNDSMCSLQESEYEDCFIKGE
ncbi:hypothetical protein FKOIJHOC_00069 [Acinetobacter phage Ab_121]|nr:hypothetical protein FKOIJHOC_00069 [Acinetobacter phage Ab_121]QQV88842.1 hypothetical protein Liucustia_142 [Acinetobacter phage Liucustia]